TGRAYPAARRSRTSPYIDCSAGGIFQMTKLRLPFAAVGLAAAFSQTSLAQTSGAQRFELASPDEQPLRDAVLATQPLTVVLKMAGDPVAVVRSRAPGKQISESERRSVADALRRQQDSIE